MSAEIVTRAPYLAPVPAPSNVRAVPAPRPVYDHDAAAERAVLAAVLLDGDGAEGVWARVSSVLRAEDFADPKHRVTFEALAQLHARSEAVDVITLARELRAMERLNTVGGAQFIGELTDALPVVAFCETHARIVLEHSARRQVAEIARGLLVRAHDLSRPLGTTLAGVAAVLDAVRLPGVTVPTMESAVDAYMATVGGETPAGPPPVPTAWSDLDDALLGGLRAGSFLLLGMPGTGKTTLAFQWAVTVAARVGPVLFIEYELDRVECTDILLGMIAGLPAARVRAQRERPDAKILVGGDRARLDAAANALHALPLHLADAATPGCPRSVVEIVALVRGMRVKPALIVIDNLGELRTRGRHNDDGKATEERMEDLRHARKLLGVPILTLAHPNREATKGAMMRRLRISDIAGGAHAERKCDGALIVHREDMHPTRDHKKEPAEPGVLEVFSPKWRGVGVVFCELLAAPQLHRFTSRRRGDPASLLDATPPAPAEDEWAQGEALPMDDPSVVFAGETRALNLGPGDEARDDGTEGASW